MNHMITSLVSSANIETKDTNIPNQAKKAITNTNKVYKIHKVNATHHAAQKDQHRRTIPREYNINETS